MAWPSEEEQQAKIDKWNEWYPIGTKVTSDIYPEEENLVTKTKAVLLFKHRLAVYLENYNGYFDLEETRPVEQLPHDTIFVKKEAPAKGKSSNEPPEKEVADTGTATEQGTLPVEEEISPAKTAPEKKAKEDTSASGKVNAEKVVSAPKKPPVAKTSTNKPSTKAAQVATAKKATPRKSAAAKTDTNVKAAAKPKKSPVRKSSSTKPKTAVRKKSAKEG